MPLRCRQSSYNVFGNDRYTDRYTEYREGILTLLENMQMLHIKCFTNVPFSLHLKCIFVKYGMQNMRFYNFAYKMTTQLELILIVHYYRSTPDSLKVMCVLLYIYICYACRLLLHVFQLGEADNAFVFNQTEQIKLNRRNPFWTVFAAFFLVPTSSRSQKLMVLFISFFK